MLWIPESHKDCTLDNFKWRSSLSDLRLALNAFINGERDRGLILIGNPGVGKSHIMVGAFKKMQERGLLLGSQLIFLQWVDLVSTVRELLANKVTPEVAIDRILPRVCIIDDIKTPKGPLEDSILKCMIEVMYEDKKIVILSTNADGVKGLTERWQLTDYQTSRIFSITDVVRIKGKDWRIE